MNILTSAKNVTFPQNVDLKPSLRGSKGVEISKWDPFFVLNSCDPFINSGPLSEKFNGKCTVFLPQKVCG